MKTKTAQDKPVEKQYYTIKLEAQVPITIVFKVLAEDPEEALRLIEKAAPYQTPRPNLSRMKKLKAQVYKFGTVMIELTKKF